MGQTCAAKDLVPQCTDADACCCSVDIVHAAQSQGWPMVAPHSFAPDLNTSLTELVHAEGPRNIAGNNFASTFTAGWPSTTTPRAASWGRFPREQSECSEDDFGIAARGETPQPNRRPSLVPPLPIGGGTAGGVVTAGKVPPLRMPGGIGSSVDNLLTAGIQTFFSARSTGRGTPAVAVYEDFVMQTPSVPTAAVDKIFGSVNREGDLMSGKEVIISHVDESVCNSARDGLAVSARGYLGGA